MEIDSVLHDNLDRIRNDVKRIARIIDIAVVPTSFTRAVMRQEDDYLERRKWEERIFEGRYHSKSKARWFFPIAYSAAGVLETARFAGLIYGACELTEKLIG